MQLDYSRLCSVDVDDFTSPNLNPSNAIHQSPKLEWRGSEVLYLKERPVSFDISSHRKGSLHKASSCHWEHHEHEEFVHNRRQSLRASRVPAKVRAVCKHVSEHKMTYACHLCTLIYIWVVYHQNISDFSPWCGGNSRRTMLQLFSLAEAVRKTLTYFWTVSLQICVIQSLHVGYELGEFDSYSERTFYTFASISAVEWTQPI